MSEQMTPLLPSLRGRRGERETLDRLLASVRAGHGQALVLRGEAGIGKSTLLEYLLERAADCRIARVVGAEAEMGLAFAGLHQLCTPFADRIECLPEPQRAALGTVLGLRDGAAPDRFRVGLAVLSLLSDVARERPLVCTVDNAQWLDRASAQVLAFAARRLVMAPVAVVFAARQPGAEQDLAGLAELVVDGLPDGDAQALLESVIDGPLDNRVRDRIVAETRGNPLALLAMGGGLTPEYRAGGIGLPCAVAMPGRIEEAFRRQLMPLPEATRRLLLVAAAEPAGDPLLVWRAVDRLGVQAAAAAPAAEAGLIEADGYVRFRHPLARWAAYRAASPAERRSAHRALAEVTDPSVDPDRRAWHRAHAATGPDEDVAAELEGSASRARARGGPAAAAALCERAADLTPDPARRARRALAAARAKRQSGASGAALRLLDIAADGPLDELGHAQAELLRAQLAADVGQDGNAPRLLLNAASRLEPLQVGLAREAYRDALWAVLGAGRLASGGGLLEVTAAVRAAPQAARPPGGCGLLLDGLAVRIAEGSTAGTPALRRALKVFHDEAATDEASGWLPLACWVSRDVWDDESWYTLSARLIEHTRQAGALTALPAALLTGLPIRLLAGELAMACSITKEAEAAGRATANPAGRYGRMALTAWRGREAEAPQLTAAARREMARRGEGQWLTVAHWVTAVLSNGLCRYDEALAAAELGCGEYPDELGLAALSMAELIEAAVRAGQPERAASAMRQLSEAATAAGSDWALGIQARSRALLSDGEPAERLYREAIDRLGRTRVRVELARAHLVYGEWLRRQGRRVDARAQLRTGYELLTAMGIDGFAERARRELLATGETVRKRTVETARQLTRQEAQVARLVGEGNTNPEIAAQLFLSPRTVEYHLHKIFRKLGISSRRELRGALPGLERAAQAALAVRQARCRARRRWPRDSLGIFPEAISLARARQWCQRPAERRNHEQFSPWRKDDHPGRRERLPAQPRTHRQDRAGPGRDQPAGRSGGRHAGRRAGWEPWTLPCEVLIKNGAGRTDVPPGYQAQDELASSQRAELQAAEQWRDRERATHVDVTWNDMPDQPGRSMATVINDSERPIFGVVVRDRVIRNAVSLLGAVQTGEMYPAAIPASLAPPEGWTFRNRKPGDRLESLRPGGRGAFICGFPVTPSPDGRVHIRFTDGTGLHWQLDQDHHLERLAERDWWEAGSLPRTG